MKGILILLIFILSFTAIAEGGKTLMHEIPITDIQGIRIGQTENAEAATGCTVFICEGGMRAGLDVRGGGPASWGEPTAQSADGGADNPRHRAVGRQRLWSGYGQRGDGVSGGEGHRL